MKSAVLDLKKWAEKTAQLVRRICLSKKGMPVGISLLFYDPMALEEEQWEYVIELAGDPREPMADKDREELAATFEYIMVGVRRIYEKGIPEDIDMSEYSAKGGFH